ncbi:MAG: hypothetical protein ACE5FA_09585, partial [Dehalococcoidia bacterium]
PFQAVETWNRMVAFETGMIAAARAGVTGAGRLNFARMVVGETQFLAGAMMRPLAVAQAPPALRMFTQFPLRMANLYGNKFRQLFNADPQVRAEAVGFLARAGLMARGATEVIRETTAGLGAEIDPSGGLIPEGFPLPQMGTPFSPFPLVPPPISMAGSALIDMAEGQFEATKYTWPLGVPAGLGLTRFAATMGVDPLAEATKKKYADWNDRLDDGRVAMYTPQGQKIGYFTPWQVTLTALGFKVGDIAAEQEATAYVVKQRDIFRQFREELREAYAANNMTEFRRVADRFRRLYPNAPLMFKPSDVRAVKRRHMMTRLRVVLESAPVELRESLQMMAPMGVMGEVEQMSPPEPVQRIEQGLGMGAFP